MHRSKFLLIAVPMISLLLLSGCRNKYVGSDATEQQHPRMQKAAELLQQQDLEGAEALYLALLTREPEFASAWLQLGMIHQRRQNPVGAIYHFRKYLDARPEGAKADIVRQMMETELVRIVDAHPMVRAMMPPEVRELQEKLDDLRLRLNTAEERAARAELQLTQLRRQTGEIPAASPGREEELEAEVLRLRQELQRLPDSGTPSPPPLRVEQPTDARIYTVVSGDHLSRISQKVYGTPHRWREILNANREQLPQEDKLRPGQTLVIP